MNERSALRNLVAFGLLMLAGAVLAVAWRYFIQPQRQNELIGLTGSDRRFAHEITLAADSFAGYAVFRSDPFNEQLAGEGIRLTIQDDGADYQARMQALADQDVQMAVFTVDAELLTGSQLGSFPGSMVMVIDQTRGADGIVAYEESVPNIQALDHPDARIVATPASPSETLARVMIADMNLPRLPRNWLVEADGARDVYNQLRRVDRSERRAFALWHPYLSRALEIPGVHVLLDTSQVSSVIVDVLVVERQFLIDQPQVVRTVVETYLRTLYSYESQSNGMVELLMSDGQKTGEILTADQAQTVVEGIRWTNTLENYAHFGLLQGQDSGGLQGLDQIIENVSRILVATDALDANPVAGRENQLYYDRILADLQADNFHPRQRLGVVGGAEELALRAEIDLPALAESEWETLVPVGHFRIPPIQFRRGSDELSDRGRRDVDGVVSHLRSWPSYYLTVVGHARADGNTEANLRLAQGRADNIVRRIVGNGIDPDRVRATAAPPEGTSGANQSVTFVLARARY